MKKRKRKREIRLTDYTSQRLMFSGPRHFAECLEEKFASPISCFTAEVTRVLYSFDGVPRDTRTFSPDVATTSALPKSKSCSVRIPLMLYSSVCVLRNSSGHVMAVWPIRT
jgi:hypothetical protein